jgi:serine/threonine protein kinase
MTLGTGERRRSAMTRISRPAADRAIVPLALSLPIRTAAYMSPEQAEGRPVDHRSDIFALGVVLYEMACGPRPFRGESFLSVVSSILKETPPPLSSVKRELPSALDGILARTPAKSPAVRYQSAAELGADLRRVKEQGISVSSTAIRQRFIVPPRSLTKYTWRPSGDHTGFQSVLPPVTSATDGPPPAGMVQMPMTVGRASPCARPNRSPHPPRSWPTRASPRTDA